MLRKEGRTSVITGKPPYSNVRSCMLVLLPEGHTSLICAPTLPPLYNYFHYSRWNSPLSNSVTLHWCIAVSAVILLSQCQGFLPLWPKSSPLQLVVFGSCCWSDYQLCAGAWLFVTSLCGCEHLTKIQLTVSMLMLNGKSIQCFVLLSEIIWKP